MSSFVSLDPAPGETFAYASTDVTLTEASTFIDVSDIRSINLYSDDTTASNRLFSFSPGLLEGQQLQITFHSDSSQTCLLSTISAAYIRVQQNWTPLQYDTIQFVWSQGIWMETGRGPVGGSAGNDDYIWVTVPAASSKWTSTCSVAKFSGGKMATMKGQFTSAADSNADLMGNFPTGYSGSFSLQVTAQIGGTVTQSDIGTSSGSFGTSPVFNTGDKIWMNFVYPLF